MDWLKDNAIFVIVAFPGYLHLYLFTGSPCQNINRFLYARLKNGTYYVTGYGVRP